MKQITGWKKHLLWVVSVCLLMACASDDPEGNEVKHVGIEVWASMATPNVCEYHIVGGNTEHEGPITLYFSIDQLPKDPGTEVAKYDVYELGSGNKSATTDIRPGPYQEGALLTGKSGGIPQFCRRPDYLGVDGKLYDPEPGSSTLSERAYYSIEQK